MGNKYFVIFALAAIIVSPLLLSFTKAAHQPEISSTMLVELEDGTWVLQVRAALTAFEYEIHTHFGKDAYTTPEAFNALVIRHLTENISIAFNGKAPVALQNGYVKLGHETNAVFEMHGVPGKIKKACIVNAGFKDIYDNQSAVILFKKGFKKQQFLLNNSNNHIVNIKAIKNQFELQ